MYTEFTLDGRNGDGRYRRAIMGACQGHKSLAPREGELDLGLMMLSLAIRFVFCIMERLFLSFISRTMETRRCWLETRMFMDS